MAKAERNTQTKNTTKVLVLTPRRVQETLLVQREDQKERYPARQKEQQKTPPKKRLKQVNSWTSERLNDSH